MAITECPMCGAKLQGTRFTGFSCSSCKSIFSARFIRQIQRRQDRELIAAHFGLSAPEQQVVAEAGKIEVREELLIPDPIVQETLDRTHVAVHQVTQHLEDIIAPDSIVPDSIAPGSTMPDITSSALHVKRHSLTPRPSGKIVRKMPLPQGSASKSPVNMIAKKVTVKKVTVKKATVKKTVVKKAKVKRATVKKVAVKKVTLVPPRRKVQTSKRSFAKKRRR